MFNRIKNVEVFRMPYNMNFDIIRNVLDHFIKLNEIRWKFNFGANSIQRGYFQESLDTILEERRNLKRRNG